MPFLHPSQKASSSESETISRAQLKDLLGATENLEGRDFLEAAVCALSRFFDAKYLFVGRLQGSGGKSASVTGIATASRGKLIDNMVYDLADTPCETVVGRAACVFPSDVAKAFPRDLMLADYGIEGYAGIPLCSQSGEIMGIVVALFDRPIEDPDFVSMILNLYSGRFANFLEMLSARTEANDSQQRLAAMMDNTPLGVVFWDAQSRIVAWRGAAPAIFGYSEEEILYHDVWDIVPDHEHDRVKEVIRNLSAEQPNCKLSNQNLCKDGRIIDCEWYNTSFRDENGELLGFSSLVLDVTQSKAHQRDLEARNAELAGLADKLGQEVVRADRANEAKMQFLATMSHELRTPLNAVIGFAEILQHEIYGPLGHPRYMEDVKIIVSSGHSLLDLVNDILDISRIASDRFDVTIEPLCPAEILREIAVSFRPKLSERQQSLTLEQPDEGPPVQADRRRLKQCLRNLINNASRYAGEGAAIELRCALDGERLTIEILDDGPGIPEKELGNLKTPFYRRSDAHTTNKDGLGLGLFIVSHLMSAMGGALTLDNRPEGGLCARLSLPVTRGHCESELTAAAPTRDTIVAKPAAA